MNEKQKRIEVVEEILDSDSIDKRVRINEIAQILQSVEMPENQFVSAPNKQEALIEAEALYNAGYTQTVRQCDVVLTRGQFDYLLTGNIAKFVRETGGKVLSKEEYEELQEKDKLIKEKVVKDIVQYIRSTKDGVAERAENVSCMFKTEYIVKSALSGLAKRIEERHGVKVE